MNATSGPNIHPAIGAAAVVAGLGALTFALFPFALPFAILLGVALVPLAPLLLLGVLAGLVIRRVGR
jgi:hypothetical protein